MEGEQELIPGLPEDLALDCIARVPHRFHPGLRPICRRWRDLVAAAAFRCHRQRINTAEDLIFIVQAVGGGDEGMVGDAKDSGKGTTAAPDLCPPMYAISMYSVADGSWHRMATPEAVPMFAQCAAVGRKLVLVGGWDPVTLEPVADVKVLDLVTGEWRRGRPMSAARSFFACSAVGGRVFVAGGHDGMKNALRTAEAYDVAADEWAAIPAMGEERDECKGVTIGGRFWAVSGYGTERQGLFSESADCYDPDTGGWMNKDGAWSDEWGSAPCFAGGDGLWCVGSRGAREYSGESRWRDPIPLPEGMKETACAAVMRGGSVFVMGASGEEGSVAGGGYGGWILEIDGGKWRRAESPAMFAGFAYSAAAVRL